MFVFQERMNVIKSCWVFIGDDEVPPYFSYMTSFFLS